MNHQTADALPVWVLTLPHLTHREDDFAGACNNPDDWPGDWQVWRDKHTVVVAAQYELEARTLAVTAAGCAIWMDPNYAHAKRLRQTDPTVILSAGGFSENE